VVVSKDDRITRLIDQSKTSAIGLECTNVVIVHLSAAVMTSDAPSLQNLESINLQSSMDNTARTVARKLPNELEAPDSSLIA